MYACAWSCVAHPIVNIHHCGSLVQMAIANLAETWM
jgi:hypothetical protein